PSHTSSSPRPTLPSFPTRRSSDLKIRHCMNIAGIVRPLALFDPPIDPGMLVKAAAAGIDISSIVNGLGQPVGPLRALFSIQKARSEEHTSELQSRFDLVCRLLLEK